MSARRILLVASALVVVLGVVGAVVALRAAPSAESRGTTASRPATTASPTSTASSTTAPSTTAPSTTAPSTTMTLPTTTTTLPPPTTVTPGKVLVLTDSVVLSGKDAVREALAGWDVTIDGEPARMVKATTNHVRQLGTVPPLVVVAHGYNSVWEKDRRNYERWATQFDQQADELVAALTRLGAQRIVWVTLREAAREVIPSDALWQHDRYAWYFPWVNERLRLLAERNPAVTLADWAAVSNAPGLTYDAIHLNADGARLMAEVIAVAMGARLPAAPVSTTAATA